MRREKINTDFTTLFHEGRELLRSRSHERIDRHREEAFRRFLQLGGVPDNSEEYKHADLLPVFDRDYRVTLHPPRQEVDPNTLFTCNVSELDTHVLLTVNGWFGNKEEVLELPGGIVICGLAVAATRYPSLLEAHYNRHVAAGERDGLVALNTAFAQDGIFVHVPAGAVMEKPLQVVNLMRGNANLMAFQRNLVIVGKGARATILVCDHTLSDHSFLSNSATEMAVGDNASLEYYHVQNQHIEASQINSLFVTQGRDARFDANIITLYGGFIRNNLFVSLTGEGGECNLHGIYLSDKKQRVDNFTAIDHIAPRCRSHEHFKGVLDDAAVATFTGRVTVRPNAQKTEAYQANHNLLLTDTARVNTRPQLVIDADDVKCSHGATVGQLNEEAMFYLRSRGIGEAEARLMMMFGFAHEIVGRVRLVPLREQLDDLIEKRLRGELTKCYNCVLHCKKF
ncbi:MAG: Fe-S cluster assembly protein SufD [Odoribacteraceae bacterium]|jgi:Fe-S cluster assembly protein SufD|nr:Fe-S cluster assembly protein SufD [Odoribacteraceae bacterium]